MDTKKSIHIILLTLLMFTGINFSQQVGGVDVPDIPTDLFPEATAADWDFKVLSVDGCQGHCHNTAIDMLFEMWPRYADAYGFTVDQVDQDPTVFTQANLAQYDVIWLNNLTKIQVFLNDEQKAALMWYIDEFEGTGAYPGVTQGGIGGEHGATDMAAGAQNEWTYWYDFLGGVYNGAGGGSRTLSIEVDDQHPAWIAVSESEDGYSLSEEWYNWAREPSDQEYVTALVMRDDDKACTWINHERKVRSIWNAIGHDARTQADEYLLKEHLGMVLYASGYPGRSLTPVVQGCMDPLYEEYDSLATEDTDPSSCVNLIEVGIRDIAVFKHQGINTKDLTVSFTGTGTHKVNVFDVSGNQAWVTSGNGDRTYSLAENLSPGIYFVKATLEGTTIQNKILVK